MSQFSASSHLIGFLTLLAGPLLSALPTRAQSVPQTVLVEHFTNTRCSICFGRNPGFYANLRQQPAGTLHLAYHPSSPYRLCAFSQQNPIENDARTNQYGIYGSTPRLVLNGNVIPAPANYADPALFAPFQGQTSPLSVQVVLTPQGTDSIAATIQVQTVAAAPLAGLTLYVALAEDTVFYAAPNGETVHHDVFRKSFTGPAPTAITPAAVGGTVTVRRVVVADAGWVRPRLYAVAIVQQAGGVQLQAGASPRLGAPLGLSSITAETAAPTVYPNPVRETLRFTAAPGATWQVVDLLGRVMARGANEDSATPTALDVRSLAAGTYVLRVSGRRTARFSKE